MDKELDHWTMRVRVESLQFITGVSVLGAHVEIQYLTGEH